MKAVRIVPVLLVALLVAVGASIPLIASSFVDRQLQHETKQWEDTSVSLVLSQEEDFFQTLELFRSHDRSQVELPGGEGMTAEEAMKAAASAAVQLELTVPAPDGLSATPMLFASSGAPVSSGIFWCCTWGDGDSQTVLWIDDQSGRVVAFDGWVGPSELYAADSPFHEAVFSVLEYCQTQYPIDSLEYDLDQAAEKDNAAISSDGGVVVEGEAAEANVYQRFASYTVVLSRSVDGLTEECALPLMLDGERIYFNL